MDWIVTLVAVVAGTLIGWAVTLLLVRRFEVGRIKEQREAANAEAARIVESGRANAESLKRNAELEAKEELLRAKEDWEKELTKRRAEVERTERRLDDREGLLDRKYSMLDEKQQQLEKRVEELESREQVVDENRRKYEGLIVEEQRKLERVAGMSVEKAKRELMRRIEGEAHAEAAQRVRHSASLPP